MEILRYCVEKGSIAVEGVSLTIAALADDAFSVALIPHTLAVTTLGHLHEGDRVIWKRTCSRSTSSGSSRADLVTILCGDELFRRDQSALRHHRGGDRGRPPGQARRGRRRGRPRERGRSDDRGAVRHARGDQLHGHARARPDLPVPDRGALRRARAQADDLQQRDAVRDGVHDLDRGPRGRDDGHLGRRPLADDPGRDRPDQGRRATSSSRAMSSR